MNIYRCSACGKWSHAQRKPQFHKRFTVDEPEDENLIADVIEDRDSETNAPFSSYFIKCGPFDTYEAVKVA